MTKTLVFALTLLLQLTAFGKKPTKQSTEPRKHPVTYITMTWTPDNTVRMTGEINRASVDATIEAIESTKDFEIYLIIDSPGGSVNDGLRFVSYLKGANKSINCVASTAGSMAFYILQECKTRYVLSSATLMQHRMITGANYQPLPKAVSQISHASAMENDAVKIQAKRIGITEAQFRALVADDWWLTAVGAVEIGAADAIAIPTCSPEAYGQTRDFHYSEGKQSAKVTWSACPLIGTPKAIEQTQ